MPNVISNAGLIFPEGDVAGLATHLIHLQNNFARRIELGALGRARVQANSRKQESRQKRARCIAKLPHDFRAVV